MTTIIIKNEDGTVTKLRENVEIIHHHPLGVHEHGYRRSERISCIDNSDYFTRPLIIE